MRVRARANVCINPWVTEYVIRRGLMNEKFPIMIMYDLCIYDSLSLSYPISLQNLIFFPNLILIYNTTY